MMRQYELVERVKAYNPGADEGLLNRAYVYAMRAHGTQKRASGDPFFAHPLEVAAILTDLRLDDATIVAAVLHDTVEDTAATLDEINRVFTPEIGRLVDGLTKIKRLDLVSKRAAQGENFRKLLLAIAVDVRVLLVKLADRLHNMRTLQHMPAEKRARIAQETLDIYAPLASRMGMQELREELEDLSFVNLKPDVYATISKRLSDLSAKSERLVESIERDLVAKLANAGITATVKGRQKRPYSIWSKMERKSVAFEQLSDIFGFRVIVDTVDTCYRALGVVHTTWPMVPGRYKDYISTPKQNDYRSIHTTVIGPKSQRVELQIRTTEMDEIGEYGIAAHALYKDGAPHLATESGAYQWLRRTIELLAEGDSPEEFLEHTKLELFQDQVFCFTPKGRLIALPRGATPIDFAYAVHTDVGNTAVGAKINGRIAPLLTELQNGDEVEIARADGQIPPAAWESLVVTGKARAAIRRATRSAVRRQYAGLGRQILDRAFERAGKNFSDEKLRGALPRLARQSTEDVFAAVGRGEMFSGDVVKAVYPDYKDERRAASQPAPAGPRPHVTGAGRLSLDKDQTVRLTWPGKDAAGKDSGGKEAGPGGAAPEDGAIPIRGLDRDLLVRFAPDGGAVPGDRIVGILTPGEGVTIYPIQSPALAAFDNEPDRWLDVRWDVDGASNQRFPARLALQSINEPGSFAQIAQVIADHDGNIDNISMKRRSQDFTDVTIDLAVWDLKHLNAIVSELRAKRVVSRVDRVNG
ncbi:MULTISPECIES: bifunctional (p)ppGpp synthetase/guanosine-3',5'-bis(diphosphate) 3'-pyrophosphohydrolase [Methylobacterium]|jgi:guanosine-3',5'-bis(diphosphate) 3'-pyrophosphohydrolase|uniref:GTP pyrophosphokinase rsh n=2 Tax=Methylobacterium TaxID=407 RepID=A0A0C6F3T3_9HYPH|nr:MULTISPECIES: bifunctional (p)ppGpp synthetase/guanosine-3',5'-bis(diphosphate) 3'-pyrophosphohydrolase [Methylobacterium]MBK3400221.1 bifunctional (p)ppGpp synthetase/guanosine-3',5'-bis(diphosphate) 3'-pyrophosphohydrolase [Methylobacterium ajmalii]MBK3407843.1 bifunctional (p)ppGpp synthetase/guanosine-3',5'-bis(diphosphate) 3'-pyrophosphohydrolase [Methylobacterium ajmalii]MBK3425408.1 bifunctional (p)ppGpp synthetase/guanosine-3',5'-bis(diphosphate) 3'-pyrophosphohydrolase [Methylobacter